MRFVGFACALPDWAGDLEQAHLLAGLGLTLDWLWEELDTEARTHLAERLARQAESLMQEYLHGEGRCWWRRLYTQNHLWVNLSGTALAAYALRRRSGAHGTAASEWLRHIHRAFDIVFDRLPEDGSFFEMGSYYLYGLRAMVIYASAAEWEDGIDRWGHGYLRNAPAFLLHTATPDGRSYVAFGNSEPIVSGQATLARLADRYRDPRLQWLAERRILSDPLARNPGDGLHCRYVLPDRLGETCLGLLWYDPSLRAQAPDPDALSAHFPDLGLVSVRSSWSRDASLMVAKCGPWGGHSIARLALTVPREEMSIGHSDPDNMSFHWFSRGVEIISDADYEMRASTASHNTIMVEEAGQHGHGIMWPDFIYNRWPQLLEVSRNGEWLYAAMDGTDAYAVETMLKLARRHFLASGSVLIVADELDTLGSNLYRSLFHTCGRARRTARGASISRHGVAVDLDVLLPERPQLRIEPRIVVARQSYGHPTVMERRGTRISVSSGGWRREARFLVVLSPPEVSVRADWSDPAVIRVWRDGSRAEFPLSRKTALAERGIPR
jgi:hypothetical protein